MRQARLRRLSPRPVRIYASLSNPKVPHPVRSLQYRSWSRRLSRHRLSRQSHNILTVDRTETPASLETWPTLQAPAEKVTTVTHLGGFWCRASPTDWLSSNDFGAFCYFYATAVLYSTVSLQRCMCGANVGEKEKSLLRLGTSRLSYYCQGIGVGCLAWHPGDRAGR